MLFFVLLNIVDFFRDSIDCFGSAIMALFLSSSCNVSVFFTYHYSFSTVSTAAMFGI